MGALPPLIGGFTGARREEEPLVLRCQAPTRGAVPQHERRPEPGGGPVVGAAVGAAINTCAINTCVSAPLAHLRAGAGRGHARGRHVLLSTRCHRGAGGGERHHRGESERTRRRGTTNPHERILPTRNSSGNRKRFSRATSGYGWRTMPSNCPEGCHTNGSPVGKGITSRDDMGELPDLRAPVITRSRLARVTRRGLLPIGFRPRSGKRGTGERSAFERGCRRACRQELVPSTSSHGASPEQRRSRLPPVRAAAGGTGIRRVA